MAENENVVVEEIPEVQPETPVNNGPSKGQKFKAGVKEWFRKKVVNLKRRPQNIPLLMLVVASLSMLLSLYVVSQSVAAAANDANTKTIGICNFCSVLLSILVIVSFLNAFPKRKKPNIFFIVLVYLMVAAIVVCDVMYYVQMDACLNSPTVGTTQYNKVIAGQPLIILHIVFLGIFTLLFALLPVYSKLINKINTKVELESATENMQGEIDIQED